MSVLLKYSMENALHSLSSAKLATGTVDIGAHFPSYSTIYSAFFKFFLKLEDMSALRSAGFTRAHRIDRNQIDMRTSPLQ